MRNGLDKPIINWEYLGALLAREDDDVQAEFFKGFCAEVRKFPTAMGADMQMFAIGKQLSEDDKEIIKSISWKEGDT